MTLDDGIELAGKYVDKSLIPARSTISGWVRAGVITKPYKRESLGRGRGMRDIFSGDLPGEIATTTYLQKVLGLPLSKIKGSGNPLIREIKIKVTKQLLRGDYDGD